MLSPRGVLVCVVLLGLATSVLSMAATSHRSRAATSGGEPARPVATPHMPHRPPHHKPHGPPHHHDGGNNNNDNNNEPPPAEEPTPNPHQQPPEQPERPMRPPMHRSPHDANGNNCTNAFDVIDGPELTQTAFQCMVSSGYQQVSIQINWNNSCTIEAMNLISSVKNAFQAGLGGADIVLVPANISCNIPPALQVASVFRLFDQAGVHFNRLWFDVSANGSPAGWKDCATNGQWLLPALRHAQKRLGPGRVGIRSSADNWHNLMCDRTDMTEAALWYMHHDNSPTLVDWASPVAFGSWPHPLAKQYAQQSMCNINVAEDFRLNGVC